MIESIQKHTDNAVTRKGKRDMKATKSLKKSHYGKPMIYNIAREYHILTYMLRKSIELLRISYNQRKGNGNLLSC